MKFHKKLGVLKRAKKSVRTFLHAEAARSKDRAAGFFRKPFIGG